MSSNGWRIFVRSLIVLSCASTATILANCVSEPSPAPLSVTPLPKVEPTLAAPPSPGTSAPLLSITPVATSQSTPSLTSLPTLPLAPQGASGIEIQSLIGPMCPVERADQPCPDQPYQATLAILDANRNQVVHFRTTADGRRRIRLPPGTYIVVPQLTGKLPRTSEQTVKVTSGQFTAITITFDSGIR